MTPIFSFLRAVDQLKTAIRISSSSTVAQKLQENPADAKPFSEMPGPKGLPFVGNVLSLPTVINNDNVHILLGDAFKKYGKIFREKIFYAEIVNLCEINAVEKVHRLEGKYPRRIVVGAWKTWREEKGLDLGILIRDGEDWKRMRTLLDRRMLRPRHVATYTDTFNEVITDFIARLRKIRDLKGGGQKVPNIDFELFHWSLETICTVLYEIRLGGLSDHRDPMIAKFIDAVQNLFLSTQQVFYLPTSLNRIFFRKAQKMHDESWSTIFNTTQILVNKKIEKIKAEVGKLDDEPSEATAGVLSYLLSTEMSLGEINSNISEIMLAAVDTTSNTMQWALYELSRHPTIQQQLHKEITTVAPLGKLPTHDDLQKMPLLKAIIKEVLRMYPVAGVSTRVLNEDLVLCGYTVPANTLVISSTYYLGRDPDLFPEPEVFRPERWLRSDGTADSIHPFAWLPFGYGPRMCIGRRVAELEMHLLLARICQTFELKPDDKPILPKVRGLIVPERPVNVTFVDRLQ